MLAKLGIEICATYKWIRHMDQNRDAFELPISIQAVDIDQLGLALGLLPHEVCDANSETVDVDPSPKIFPH